ncbi:MAG: hypothetical protein AAFR76_03140 [Planctomycetota bacterium]
MAHDDVAGRVATEEELLRLPRLARVAFAARCAERVQAVYEAAFSEGALPDVSTKHLNAVQKAVALARAFANDPENMKPVDQDGFMNFTEEAMSAALHADSLSHDQGTSYNAAAAASRAVKAADSAAFRHDYFTAQSASEASSAAAQAASAYAAIDFARTAMRCDLELLKAAASREEWNDERPVSPDFFGPLWPEGEPEGWPEEGREVRAGDEVFSVTLDLPADVSDDEIENLVRELSVRLDESHVAEGGRGVVIDSIDLPRRAAMPMEVSP